MKSVMNDLINRTHPERASFKKQNLSIGNAHRTPSMTPLNRGLQAEIKCPVISGHRPLRFKRILPLVMMLCSFTSVFLRGQKLWAYEPLPTHAGLSAQALMNSDLHTFLRTSFGQKRGLFTALHLDAKSMDIRLHRHISLKLKRLDPAAGLTPGKDGKAQFLSGWVLAGSVFAELPASNNRNHFFCPATQQGLDNESPLSDAMLSIAALLEGGDSMREFLTGTGFELKGIAAWKWAVAPDNPYSEQEIYRHWANSIALTSPSARNNEMILAMVGIGGLLHVLQDMASPTHVRNDFLIGHLQKLGKSFYNRASAYERFVAETFGEFGLPEYRQAPIEKAKIRDFFSSKNWQGLADITHLNHFSPGTVPPPILISSHSNPKEILKRLRSKLAFQKPDLTAVDLRCAASSRTCYLPGKSGPLLAYHLDQENRLVFSLDKRTFAATARHLLPLAVGYSTGLINFLTRGKLEVKFDGQDLRIKNAGIGCSSGRLRIFWENEQGQRKVLKDIASSKTVKKGQKIASLSLHLPTNAKAIAVLFEGKDIHQQPMVAAQVLDL